MHRKLHHMPAFERPPGLLGHVTDHVEALFLPFLAVLALAWGSAEAVPRLEAAIAQAHAVGNAARAANIVEQLALISMAAGVFLTGSLVLAVTAVQNILKRSAEDKAEREGRRGAE